MDIVMEAYLEVTDIVVAEVIRSQVHQNYISYSMNIVTIVMTLVIHMTPIMDIRMKTHTITTLMNSKFNYYKN